MMCEECGAEAREKLISAISPAPVCGAEFEGLLGEFEVRSNLHHAAKHNSPEEELWRVDRNTKRAAVLSAHAALEDELEMAWVILANAGGGDWTKETPEWQRAAGAWRDRAMPAISSHQKTRAALAKGATR